jgi:hypothetical protein
MAYLTGVNTQRIGGPATEHDRRVEESMRKWAADVLSGRTVWSAVGIPEGRRGARALGSCLAWAGESGVGAQRLDVRIGDPLRAFARRLEQRLRGGEPGSEAPGAADGELYTGGAGEADALLERDVREGDVVVLHDPLAVVMAEAVRARGAHAVWEIRIAVAEPVTWDFLRRHTAAVDAFALVRGGPAGTSRIAVRQVAALLPSRGLVRAKLADTDRDSGDLAWASALADVVVGDRDERVGGTRHARPAVAVR